MLGTVISSMFLSVAVGDCVTMNIVKEPWESANIVRIEELGIRSHRASIYSYKAGKWYPSLPVYKWELRWGAWRKVPCP